MSPFSPVRRFWRRFFRFVLAAILFAACLAKALDVDGFLAALDSYQLFPEWSVLLVALGTLAAEGGLGVWLMSGRHLALTAIFSAALYGLVTLVSVITLLRGIVVPNCGCFGVFIPHPLDWTTVSLDVLMMFWSAALYLFSDRKLRAEGTP